MIDRKLNILKFIEKNKSAFLFGARGTGKTSYLRALFAGDSHHINIDLLNHTQFRRYFEDPDLLIGEVDAFIEARRTCHVVIDDVQKIPKMLYTVHLLIEKHRGAAVFVLTSSSARKLKRGGANLLAGRAITNYLHPLLSEEVTIDLARALQYGTLPTIYLTKGLEIETVETYMNTYLREEILEESLVRKLENFIRFIDVAAQMKSSFRYGKLFETLIVNEIYRINDYNNLGLRFHYWRDKNGKEVDIILSRSLTKPLSAIEINKNS